MGPGSFFIGLIVLAVLGTCLSKYQLSRAVAPLEVMVPLPPERVAAIGVKASGSLFHRMSKSGGRMESLTSGASAAVLAGGGRTWQVKVRGGTVVFNALPHGGGTRLVGWADEWIVAQANTNLNGIMGLGFAMGNAVNRALGIPRNPGSLNRRRRRVFKAVTAAAEAKSGAPT